MTESLEAAFTHGNGRIIIRNLSSEENLFYSRKYECYDCGIIYMEPEPRLFSFNNPYGACHVCQGFGRSIGIDNDLVIPDKSKTINKGAIIPFKSPGHSKHLEALKKIAPKKNIPLDVPYQSLSEEQTNIIWNGSGKYIGINGFFKQLEDKSYKLHYRVMLSRYRGYTTCHACSGSRIRTSARQVFVNNKNIPELINMPLNALHQFISSIQLSEHEQHIAGQVLKEIQWRLQLLIDIGLEYLTLGRLTHTLSGGEAQRINLSTALGSSLVGTLYVLDEPSIGLHPRDTNRLLNILFKLRDLGNTVIVVEHDPDIINKADYLVDIGPMAGEFGGELIFAGPKALLESCPESLTYQYLTAQKSIDLSKTNSDLSENKCINIYNPRMHNLNIEKVSFPLNCICVISGVSGSGKSTLVHHVLYNSVKKIPH